MREIIFVWIGFSFLCAFIVEAKKILFGSGKMRGENRVAMIFTWIFFPVLFAYTLCLSITSFWLGGFARARQNSLHNIKILLSMLLNGDNKQ